MIKKKTIILTEMTFFNCSSICKLSAFLHEVINERFCHLRQEKTDLFTGPQLCVIVIHAQLKNRHRPTKKRTSSQSINPRSQDKMGG